VEIGEHALRQAERRGLDEATLMRVAEHPEQVVAVGPGREVRQSRVRFPPDDTPYLVRVIVDTTGACIRVITAYRTSKIAKYWRAP
jgi:hypothetical protein